MLCPYLCLFWQLEDDWDNKLYFLEVGKGRLEAIGKLIGLLLIDTAIEQVWKPELQLLHEDKEGLEVRKVFGSRLIEQELIQLSNQQKQLEPLAVYLVSDHLVVFVYVKSLLANSAQNLVRVQPVEDFDVLQNVCALLRARNRLHQGEHRINLVDIHSWIV